VKTFALATLVLGWVASPALRRGRFDPQDDLILTSRSPAGGRESFGSRDPGSDALSEPFSSSPEALRLGEEEPAFAPRRTAGFLQAHRADHGAWFCGLQARLPFAPSPGSPGPATLEPDPARGCRRVLSPNPRQGTTL